MNKKINTLILAGIISLSTSIVINAEKIAYSDKEMKTEDFQPDPGPMNEMGKPEHDPDSDKYEPFQPDPGPMGEMGKPKHNKNKKVHTSTRIKNSKNTNKSTKRAVKKAVNKAKRNNTVKQVKTKKEIKKHNIKKHKKVKQSKKQDVKEVSKYNETSNIKNPKTSDNNTIMLISAGTLIAAGAGLYYIKTKK